MYYNMLGFFRTHSPLYSDHLSFEVQANKQTSKQANKEKYSQDGQESIKFEQSVLFVIGTFILTYMYVRRCIIFISDNQYPSS